MCTSAFLASHPIRQQIVSKYYVFKPVAHRHCFFKQALSVHGAHEKTIKILWSILSVVLFSGFCGTYEKGHTWWFICFLFSKLSADFGSSKSATPQGTSFFESGTLWLQKKLKSLECNRQARKCMLFRIFSQLPTQLNHQTSSIVFPCLKASQTCSSTFFENPVSETLVRLA